MGKFILPLVDPDASLENVGGKGASLSRLAAAGFPVPAGFHVATAAYRRFVEDGRLGPVITASLAGIKPDKPESLEGAAAAIREAFSRVPIYADMAAAIGEAYSSLSGGSEIAVAVRSSATAEDLPGLSFAGLQESFLNVSGKAELLDAVRRCWASLWTGRAVAYRKNRGFPQDDLALAVVVQVLVDADSSGVMFTADPGSGRRDRIVINAAWGLGEAIVGGIVTPDVVVVGKAGGLVLERSTADKTLRTVRGAGGTGEEPNPESLRLAPVLDDAAAVELAALGERIESLYGAPTDIEWAREGGRFLIVQARPITALPEAEPEPPSAWDPPVPKMKCARSSVADFIPSPMSPLFETLGIRMYNEGINDKFSSLFGTKDLLGGCTYASSINGYLYITMSFPAGVLLRIIGSVIFRMGKFLREAEPRWMADHASYSAAASVWEKRDATRMGAAELLSAAEALWREAVSYVAGFQTGAMQAAMAEMVLTRLWEKSYRGPGDPPAASLLLGYESAPVRADEALWAISEKARANESLRAWLSSASPVDIVGRIRSGAAPDGVEAAVFPVFRDDFLSFLSVHGKSVYELDFSEQIPFERPEPFVMTLKHWLEGGAGPVERRRDSAARRDALSEMARARTRGPRGWLFKKVLKWAQHTAPIREDAIAGFGLGFPALRRFLFELGSRIAAAGSLERADDVFYLVEEELRDAVSRLDSGSVLPKLAAAVRARRAERKSRRRVIPPAMIPSLGRVMGFKVSSFLPDSSARQSGRLKGIGASGGRATAPARVLRGPENFGRMKSGEVLVADITTPAWTPLFALAAAIVTDVGGPLSHGSIVAREYGIPAVLNTGSATRRLKDGDIVTVDGDSGIVTWAEAEPWELLPSATGTSSSGSIPLRTRTNRTARNRPPP